MLGRICNSDGSTLGDSQHWKPVELDGVDKLFEIAYPRREGEVADVPVRESIAALVITHEGVVLGEFSDPVRPDRTMPFEVEMVEPVRCLDQWRAIASERIGDLSSVIGVKEPYLLIRNDRNDVASLQQRGSIVLVRNGSDVGSEAISLARNGLDVAVVFSEKLPKLGDA